jgi:hypothetical protein
LRVVVQEADGNVVGGRITVVDDRGQEVGGRYPFDFDAIEGQPSAAESGQRIGPLLPGHYKVTATNHDRQDVTQDVSVSGEEELVVALKFGA